MSSEAFESYLVRWREADPQHATAWLFLRHEERIRFGGLAALEGEWAKAVRDAREPQVAATKLGWWREEMQRASQGEARHPLTQAIFLDARVRAVPSACWSAAVDASLLALNVAPPADVRAQLAAARPVAAACADIETRVWFGGGVDSTRAAQVIAVARILANLRDFAGMLERGRAPLPMNLLARHGLALDELAGDSPARRAAMRDLAESLERELAPVATMAGPLGLFRAAGLQHDLQALRRAAHADDPLAVLQEPARGFRNLLKTWQAARIWRGYTFSEVNA